MYIQPPTNTPYQKLKNSKVGTIVRENKVLTGVATVATGVVVAGGAAQSTAFAHIAEKGLVPAFGAGVATLGALAAHDAVVNDFPERPIFGSAKALTGVAAALGGGEIIGRTYGIPVLEHALSTPLEKAFNNGQALIGTAVTTGGVMAGKFAVERFQKASAGENKARNIALGTAGVATSATAILGGAELIGRNFKIPVMDQALTGTIQFLSSGGIGSVAGGVLLAGGAAQLANEAVNNFRKEGNDFITVAEATGAVTAGLGGVQLAGHGLGLKATEGLLTEHAPLVAAAALTGSGLAAIRTSAENIKEKGLRPINSLGLTAGAITVPAGLAVAADSFKMEAAARFMGHAASTGAGLGLAATSVAMGKAAVEKGRQGDVMTAAGLGLGAAAAGSGSLFALGDGLNIPVLKDAGKEVVKHTWEPFVDHVVEPTANFLFHNPVVGGVALAVGVGGYLYARYRANRPDQP